MKQIPTNRAHTQRALTYAVLLALVVGPALATPVSAETAAPQLRLTVDAQERARLLAEQQRVRQTANSVGTNWNQLIQRWQDASTAPNESSFAGALERIVDAAESLDGQLGRYEEQIRGLRARYVDLYDNAADAPTQIGPDLHEIGADLARLGEPFERFMTPQSRRGVATRIQMAEMAAQLRRTAERLGSSSALATRGDFVGAVRMLDDNLLTIEVQRDALRAQIETVLARAQWTATESLVVAPFDPVGMDDLIIQIPDTVFRFMDAPEADPVARNAPTSAFGRLLR